MNTLLVEAEALFGSTARQDHDEVSDRDYLIVDDDKARLRARKARLAAQGFSVADYTWRRLGRLVKSQALFAIHLKNEARVLHDQFGRLSQLLKSAEPKTSYSADFMASLALFRPLADIPEGEHGLAWAADVAAVAFRNSAILRLANEGRFVFGQESILVALADRGYISESSLPKLRWLRLAKHAYRGGLPLISSRTFLEECLLHVEQALGVDFERSGGVPRELDVSPSTAAYVFARTVERDLLRNFNGSCQSPAESADRRRLLKLVRDPHAYLWQFIHRRAEIEHQIRRIAEVHNSEAAEAA